MNVLNLPFDANTFDFIICNQMLEHIEPDRQAMSELHRVLKPGGQAILQVPISKNSPITYEDFSVVAPSHREQVFGQFDHVRIYGQDYSQRLEQVGFKVNKINLYSEFPKAGLIQDEHLFVCSK